MWRLLATAWLLTALPGPGDETGALPTVEETRAEFTAVCQRLRQSDNHYFGLAMVEDLEARLASPVDDPQVAVMLRGRLAHELIRLGRHQRAVELFSEAIDLFESALEGPQRARLAANQALREALLHGLGAAHFQIAEDQNCVALHVPASCILPIRREAVHPKPEHARAAGDVYLRRLAEAPGDIQARWLLNLSRMVSGDYPAGVPEPLRLPPQALAPEADLPLWVDIAPRLGLDGDDLSGGAAMEDLDGDGLLDLVSSSWDPCAPMKAYRNDGRGGFEEVTEEWGLDGQLGGLNLVQTDFDNDGMPDLLVLRGAWLGKDGRIRNSLLRNDLKRPAGRFVDVTAAAGLAYPAYPTQAASWADYDGDGDLDLFVGNEATAVAVDPLQLFGRGGDSYPAQLFRNNGDGTFTDVARAAGVQNQSFAKAAAWGDWDDDGDPDLYVSNIGPNRFFRNNGDGTFSDLTDELGLAEPVRGSFATWFFDFDNDGDLDLFVAAYHAPVPDVSASYLGLPTRGGGHPVVYRNDGGRFTDVSAELGLERPLLPMGANYGDIDGDGYPDVYLGTGVPNYEALMPNVMYLNDAGRRFRDVTFAGGFGHLQKGHGIAFGDLDNDGDQDLFEQLGGAYPYDGYRNVLFENPAGERSWITLRLVGRRANRAGVGARIEVRVREGETTRSVHALAGTGGSFGGSSLQQEIGLGRATAIERLSVRWPGSDSRQEFRDVPLDGFYQLTEGEEKLVRLDLPRLRLAAGQRPGEVHRHQGPAR